MRLISKWGGEGMKIDFNELYERFFKDVYLFVLAMSKDPHIAEEITQETFFKALKEAKNFRGSCSVKTWLCQIAKNLYISNTRRKKPVHSEALEDMPDDSDIENIYIQKDQALSIYKVLHCLSEPYKEVFTLRVLGDLSFKEIAEIFEKQENWARVTYHRARLKIREHMTVETSSD
jgi:RNA polymerase sigma-70 factor (ECF subfamily)